MSSTVKIFLSIFVYNFLFALFSTFILRPLGVDLSSLPFWAYALYILFNLAYALMWFYIYKWSDDALIKQRVEREAALEKERLESRSWFEKLFNKV